MTNTAAYSHTSGGDSAKATFSGLGPPLLAVTKAVTPEAEVEPGDVVTYSLILSNTGLSPALNVMLTDTLPTEVDFAQWVSGGQPPGASVDAGDEITWQGTVSSGGAVPFAFVVTYSGGIGEVVSNTVEFAHSSGGDSATAGFAVRPRYTVYLPLILRNYP